MKSRKYIFQYGGPNNDPTGGQFFNSLADQVISQQESQQEQQPAQQYSTQDNTPDQSSDFIKNLTAYDESQHKNDIIDRLDALEKSLNARMDSLSAQQVHQDWASSEDGQQFMSEMYDTQIENKEPVLLKAGLQQRQLMAESGGYDNAISPKGAMGAYQFMPSTWEEYKPRPDASPFNRADAQAANTHYMNDLMNQFNGDERKATAAYNAGPGRVSKLVNTYGSDWESHLPKETKGYLNTIFSNSTNNNSNIGIKKGVDLQGVNSNLLNIVSKVNSQHPGLVITSGTDSKHMNNSAHYDGEALDIGANSSNKDAYNKFKQELPDLQKKYGIKYLDEGDHIHISLSSKGKT